MEEEYYDEVLSALFDYVAILEASEEEYLVRDTEMDNMYWKLDELIVECTAIINNEEEDDVEEGFEEIEEDMVFKRKLHHIQQEETLQGWKSDFMNDTPNGNKMRKLEFGMNLSEPTCNN